MFHFEETFLFQKYQLGNLLITKKKKNQKKKHKNYGSD